ncbi:MAG TPA: hypothetical protein DCX89_00015 [Saprospirales bacterium]|nr:hypothetical protein [Saprospirales bacterium]
MENKSLSMVILYLVLLLVIPIPGDGQIDSLRNLIGRALIDQNVPLPIDWETNNMVLRKTTFELLHMNEVEYTQEGLFNVISKATLVDYDNKSDSLLLNELFIRSPRIDSLFYWRGSIPGTFLKSSYNSELLDKISFFVKPESVLYWESYTPYYLSFLNIEGIDSTLLFVKKNIKSINQLRKANNYFIEFDTMTINVCLARLGIMNDTVVIDQLKNYYKLQNSRTYLQYFRKLSQIRTKYAFQQIGDVLISDLEHIGSLEWKMDIYRMAISGFITYVLNFPDRSTKFQDNFDEWLKAKRSRGGSKNFSTKEYIEMARNWYIQNKDNLVLDYDKY